MNRAWLCIGALVVGCAGSEDGPALDPTGAQYSPSDAPWYQSVADAPVDRESGAVMAGLVARGGFGLGQMVIDFDLAVLGADDGVPMMPFNPTKDFYEPDCDLQPMPVPAGGSVEGERGYTCTSGRDCHLLVLHRPTQKLYEMWRADIVGATFKGGCLAVWDVTRNYWPKGRGANCTSADAAGLPIAPLLFGADEVAAGQITHAVRLVLPNDRIRRGVYVAPATHSTRATGGAADTPPYGARLRLRADFPVELLPTDGARVVARALQSYGMFLADGGNKALTAKSDRFTQVKWGKGDKRLLGENDLAIVRITDFEMVDGGERIPFTGECERVP
jgi:serine/threonine-protein kinase